MKTLSILIILVMFGCNKEKANSVDEEPIRLNSAVCSEAIGEMTKLSGRPAIEVASKLIELSALVPNSVDKTTSCLDANLKIVCNQSKCFVAKKNI